MRLHGWSCAAATLVGLAIAAAVGCGDSTGPDEVPEDELPVLTIRGDAPALETSDTFFYAKKGEFREVKMFFTDGAGGRGSEYFRLEVRPDALLAAPDGTPFLPGDSVLITVRVVDPARILFDLQPSGLRFNPLAPSHMIIHYTEANPDFDRDGDVDANDDALQQSFSLWMQEEIGGVFTRLQSTVNLGLKGVGADVGGFTRYAISY